MDVVFPDGTVVRASSLSDRVVRDPARSFGLYLDPRWLPTWPAEVIDWRDFGLPADSDEAADQIVAAFARARRGDVVEVGCVGGLGRTGTVLACMAVLAGEPPDSAVDWVRREYNPSAVETSAQEQWVRWFADRLTRRYGSMVFGMIDGHDR
jgi:Swiss Army Knife protein, DSP-PTPase phosphatase domain